MNINGKSNENIRCSISKFRCVRFDQTKNTFVVKHIVPIFNKHSSIFRNYDRSLLCWALYTVWLNVYFENIEKKQ